MPSIPQNVFRAYDIRGVAEKDITEELCKLVGKGFGSELRERTGKEHPTVIVGRDARTHGIMLEQALIEGLVSTGVCVKKIGQTPSPVNYFALCTFENDGSIQVTASHNPKEDNGLKLQTSGAEAYAGEDLQILRRRIAAESFLEGEGSIENVDAITPYKKRMETVWGKAEKCQSPLKVVADFGNGVAGPVYGSVLRALGIDLVELYAEPDGTFPNHPADPSKHETLAKLREVIKKEKAHVGLAFDGDGDRVGVVDERGEIVSPDYLLLALAEDHLQRHADATVVYTVSMSGILQTEIERMGGKTVLCPVGHSFVEHTMREHGSHLGGEQSGHFFCGEDYFDYDDALVAALHILRIFRCSKNTAFSNLFSQYPRVFQSPEWRPHCADEEKNAIVQAVIEHFRKEGYPIVTLDGARIEFGEGAWAGIRQSNTSPKLSICVEARSKEKLEEIEKLVRTHLAEYPQVEA